MAEFQKVAYEKRRLCKAFKEECSNCPLTDIDCGVLCVRYTEDDTIVNLEKIIMDWAEKNPEPVYPTWEEWLLDNGVFAPDNVLLNGKHRFYMEGKPVLNIPTKKIYDRIPADIAEKLGIEPEPKED